MNDYECETCDREFGSQQAVNQHMDALDHWGPQYDCETCDRKFNTQNAANQHMNDTGHWECETCDRQFYTQNSANQHMNDTGHWNAQFKCETCDRRFHTQNSANQHMGALNHYKLHYCNDCSREFQSENALKMHLNSSIHRDENVQCPFCKAALTSVGGLSYHLETGSCPRDENINRDTIVQAIRQHHDTLQALNQHLDSLNSNKLYSCLSLGCNHGFDSLASLSDHLKSCLALGN